MESQPFHPQLDPAVLHTNLLRGLNRFVEALAPVLIQQILQHGVFRPVGAVQPLPACGPGECHTAAFAACAADPALTPWIGFGITANDVWFTSWATSPEGAIIASAHLPWEAFYGIPAPWGAWLTGGASPPTKGETT